MQRSLLTPLGALALAFLGSITVARGPAPTGPAAAPGEILVRVAAHALDGGRGKRSLAPTALAHLRDSYGVQRMDRVAIRSAGRSRGILERFGLDRIHVVHIAPTTDVAELVELATRLESDPLIEVAHPNWRVEAGEATTADSHFATQWHLSNTGQEGGTPGADASVAKAWAVTVGRPETLIAVLDSGIDGDHHEFRGRIAPGGWDTANDDADPEDNHGHGTQVWGIAGATPNNDFAVAGINWRARVQPYKVLITTGGTVGDLIAGLGRLAVSGADIANLSLVSFRDSSLLHDAVSAAHAAGVILIGCNGNDGSTTVNYPSAYPELLATGWTDRDDTRAPDSNRTSTLDIVAPGLDIPTAQYASIDDVTSSFSGCSAATPSATGVASLLLGLDPTLTFEQIRDILRATAEDEVGDPGFDLPGRDDHYGWGRLDADAAVRALGLVSNDRIHVEGIALRRPGAGRLEVHVTVLDDLQGIERDVEVSGTLTTADRETFPLVATTGGNGVAVLAFEPVGGLPSGAFTFEVDALTAAGRAWAPETDVAGPHSGDPLAATVHVGGLVLHAWQDTLIVEVQVLDDDAVPEGAVNVAGRITPPRGSDEILQAPTYWAAGGVARIEFSPPGGLVPGAYTFDVLQLQKDDFAYEADRNVATTTTLEVLDPSGDIDEDGATNDTDNCPAVANPAQLDADADGVGDPCDVCATRPDPAQRDSDGDGAGNRCDCAPYDVGRTGLGDVPFLVWDDARSLRWHGTSGADRYDLLQGTIGALDGADYGACLANDLTEFTRETAATPAPGQGFFYLVRGDDTVCGAGPIGHGVGGASRINANAGRCAPF